LPGSGGIGYGRESKGRFWVQATHGAGARAVIEAARKEIGVREVGKNAGKRVGEYLVYTGIKVPAPYCASFVSWCFGQAGYKEPKTAWSPALFPDARSGQVPAKGQVVSPTPLRELRGITPGLVFGIYFPDLKRIAHVGIVEMVLGDYIQTIEGNTSADGSRQGIGVFRRLRHKRTICKYSNWL
jgi:hypothetical protein